MHYVYVLKSVDFGDRHYVGQTWDLKQRLADHNAGKSTFTRPFKPWKIACYLGFESETCAIEFERYLKTGSGRTFLKRHLITP